MYAEYTQPQLTFLALVPWKDETNLKQILRNGEQQKKGDENEQRKGININRKNCIIQEIRKQENMKVVYFLTEIVYL